MQSAAHPTSTHAQRPWGASHESQRQTSKRSFNAPRSVSTAKIGASGASGLANYGTPHGGTVAPIGDISARITSTAAVPQTTSINLCDAMRAFTKAKITAAADSTTTGARTERHGHAGQSSSRSLADATADATPDMAKQASHDDRSRGRLSTDNALAMSEVRQVWSDRSDPGEVAGLGDVDTLLALVKSQQQVIALQSKQIQELSGRRP